MSSDASVDPSSRDEHAPRLKADPVDKFIFDGIQAKFLELFNVRTAWVTSTDEVKAIDKLFPDLNKNTAPYPYATLRLSLWEVAEDRGNLRMLSMRGVPVAKSTDEKTFLYAKLLPVNFTVLVKFVTNDYRQIKLFSRIWTMAAKTGGFSFQVEYGMTTFDIFVGADTAVTFPQREGNPDDVQEYLQEFTLQVRGYISEHELRQAQIVDEVCITGILGEENREFWSFCPNDPVVPEEPVVATPLAYFGTPSSTPTTSNAVLALPGTSTSTLNNAYVDANGGDLSGSQLPNFTIFVPIGATRISFAYPATSRDVASIRYQDVGNYEAKTLFTKSTVMLAATGGNPSMLYNVYTWVPIEPFAVANNYKIFI